MTFLVSATPININALSKSLKNDGAGAFATFEGWVRNKNEGFSVDALEYEVFHDLALSEGRVILDEAIHKYGLSNAAAVHREGDCAIWIGVTAPHRGEAFDACRYIIDEMKHRLPVWKKEYYSNQEPQWVNCQHHHHHTPRAEINARDYYARQTILPQIGDTGQDLLTNAKILVVGAGGLGSSAALALAGAGVGVIGIADHDDLSASNLHRQILYSVDDIGKPKAHLAASRLKQQNPFVTVNVHHEKVTSDNVEDLFDKYDLILDCTDNFASKYLLNDAAILCNKLLVQASIYQFEGQLLIINPRNESGCLRCLFNEAPQTGMVGDCATAGILGTVPMTLGTLQANEAIKLLLGIDTLSGLATFDLLSLGIHHIKRKKREDCPVCGTRPSRTSLLPNVEYTPSPNDTSWQQEFVIIDVRENMELAMNPFPAAYHLPTSNFDVTPLDADKDAKLLVVCAHGIRSLNAANYLRQAGWKNCYSLSGGIANLSDIHDGQVA